MNIAEILTLQSQHPEHLVLVRDRLFWQAWEISAWRFVTQVRPYKVHRRLYKNVAKELTYLGFPRTALEDVLLQALELGLAVVSRTEQVIVLSCLGGDIGYAAWRDLRPAPNTNPVTESPHLVDRLLPVYRLAYDLALDLNRLMAKVSREHKYGLAERVRQSASDLLFAVHRLVNRSRFVEQDQETCRDALVAVRLWLRLLHDLREISTGSWGKSVQALDALAGHFARIFPGPDSGASWCSGASPFQSSIPPACEDGYNPSDLGIPCVS